jgi:hypothetical protein
MQGQSLVRPGKIHSLGDCEGRDPTKPFVKIVVLDAAKRHLIEGFSFYETQSPGLGTYFLDSLFADIDSLAIYAGNHSSFNGFLRCHSRRFPFAVYYLIQEGEVRVYAVLDSRRRPSFIKVRLEQCTDLPLAGENGGI